jgi:hypothetical protein
MTAVQGGIFILYHHQTKRHFLQTVEMVQGIQTDRTNYDSVQLTAVAYLVEALCYKPGHWMFSIHLILLVTLGPRVYLASNRNEYQKVFLGSRAHPVRKTDNLTAICEPIVHDMWEPTATCYRDNFTADRGIKWGHVVA